MFTTFAYITTIITILNVMADTPNFNPNDIVNFMNASAKQSAHNAHIRSEFKKLQQHVADFAKLFADDYEVPAPKQRAKRGTGEIAMKKAAQAGTATPDLNQVKADAKTETQDIFTTSKGTTLKVPGMTPPVVNVVRKEDQKK